MSSPVTRAITTTPREARRRLIEAGLRPSRARVALLRLLLEGGDRHLTPDDLRAQAEGLGLRFSLATIYNNLNRFNEAGLLRRITLGPGQVFFDTNTSHHHHVYDEGRGELRSVPARADGLVDLPEDLAGIAPERLDIVVRIGAADAGKRPDDA